MKPITLQIRVYDEIKVTEKQPQKERRIERVFPVFVMETRSVLDILFAGVENYSRPPTQEPAIKLPERAFSAFPSKFMVSSLTT